MPRFKIYKQFTHSSRLAGLGISERVLETIYTPSRYTPPRPHHAPKQLTLEL